ncbi:hypothetical protein EAG_04003, partial [Camponotus floridanus]
RTARYVLNHNYNGHWIEREDPVLWLARSPKLTFPDFFLWGYLKDKVYIDVPTIPENMGRIQNACANIKRDVLLCTHQSFLQKIGMCIEVEGHDFEHLL